MTNDPMRLAEQLMLLAGAVAPNHRLPDLDFEEDKTTYHGSGPNVCKYPEGRMPKKQRKNRKK